MHVYIIPKDPIEVAKEGELSISNALSFIDIGSGNITAMESNNENLYLSIEGKGMAFCTNKGIEYITTSEADKLNEDKERKTIV